MSLPTPYYSRDGIVIYHGDCLALLPELPSGSVDAVVCDPPYGLGDLLHRPGRGANSWQVHFSTGRPEWDTAVDVAAIVELFNAIPIIVWGGHLFGLPKSRGWLVWDKVSRGWTSGECELAWTNLDQPVRAFDYARCELANEGKQHPTQKPLPLMVWCLSFLPEGVIVFDPFCGSGTTAVACIKTGRKCIGMEISEQYAEIAARRCEEAFDAQGLFRQGETP